MTYFELDRRETKWATCEKCHTRYNLHCGRHSKRKSCTLHDWNKTKPRICEICYIIEDYANAAGCYHISNKPRCLPCALL